MKLTVCHSITDDAFQNQGAEAMLSRHCKPDEFILYTYVSSLCVAVGLNQNARAECRVAQLEADGGKLCRRLSGGGAVLEDLGCVNYAFIAPTALSDAARQVEAVRQALLSFGVNAVMSGRNDLIANGRKFSGNAFCRFKGEACGAAAGADNLLHHGTLLVHTDMSLMPRYLNPSPMKLAGHGVPSVAVRVANLCDLGCPPDCGAVCKALGRAYADALSMVAWMDVTDGPVTERLPPDVMEAGRREFADDRFRYGDDAIPEQTLRKRFGFGEVEARLRVEGGTVVEAQIYSDAMDPLLPGRVRALLEGKPYPDPVWLWKSVEAMAEGGDAPEAEDAGRRPF